IRDRNVTGVQTCALPISVTQGEMTHSGQADLDFQAESAIRRKIGTAGGFGWDTEVEGETVALLDAVTLAHYAAKTTKRNPARRQIGRASCREGGEGARRG